MRSFLRHRLVVLALIAAAVSSCTPANAAEPAPSAEPAFVIVSAEVWLQLAALVQAQEREIARLKAEARSRKVCL